MINVHPCNVRVTRPSKVHLIIRAHAWTSFVRRLTWLLGFAGGFLDGAALAEAAHWAQPFPQSVSWTFWARRAGLQRTEGWLRLQVCHRLALPVSAAHMVF